MRYQLNPVVDVLRTKYGSVAKKSYQRTLDEITAVYTRRGWNWRKRLDRVKLLLDMHKDKLSRRELAYVAVLNRGIASRYLRKAKVKNIEQVRSKIATLAQTVRKYTVAKPRVMLNAPALTRAHEKAPTYQCDSPGHVPVYRRLRPGEPIRPGDTLLRLDIEKLQSTLEKTIANAFPVSVNAQEPSEHPVKISPSACVAPENQAAVEKPISYWDRIVAGFNKMRFGAENYLRKYCMRRGAK